MLNGIYNTTYQNNLHLYDFICVCVFFKLISYVQDVVTSLRDKLCLSADEHFSLVLEHVKSLKRNKLTLLDPDETLARVRATNIFLCYIFWFYTNANMSLCNQFQANSIERAWDFFFLFKYPR